MKGGRGDGDGKLLVMSEYESTTCCCNIHMYAYTCYTGELAGTLSGALDALSDALSAIWCTRRDMVFL